MAHGVRKGVVRGVRCPAGKSASFSSWDAAEATRVRLNAERVYACSGCGYLHVTRYTEAEYFERLCTNAPLYGSVVRTDEEENGHEAEEEGKAGYDGQPSAGCRDAGEAAQFGVGFPRLPPSPAAFARILASRRDS